MADQSAVNTRSSLKFSSPHGPTLDKIFPGDNALPYTADAPKQITSQLSTTFLKPAEMILRQINTILEAAVQVRAAELQAVNVALHTRIAEHEAVKLALRCSEERYRILTEMLPDALFVDEGNRISYANPAFLRLVGAITLEQVLGKPPLHFFHPTSHKLVQARNKHLFTKGDVLPLVELKVIRLDGVVIEVESTTAFSLDQQNNALQTILRGITVRKQTEEQHQAVLTQLAAQHQQIQLLNQKIVSTQENERKHLARELHDQIGQDLTALTLNLRFLREQIAHQLPEEMQLIHNLDDAHALVMQINTTVRNLISELRPPPLDEFGLLAALRWYGQSLSRRTNLKIEVFGEEPVPKLAEPTALALFRIAQEALTNVSKHAQASRVEIHLWADSEQVYLTIDDNGRGFDPTQCTGLCERSHWGILGMQERAVAVGGELTIESCQLQGTIVQVII